MSQTKPATTPDGLWYWDGTAWRTLLSPDHTSVWTGSAWEPLTTIADPSPPRRCRALSTNAVLWIGAGCGGALGLTALVVIAIVTWISIGGIATANTSAVRCQPTEQLVGHYHTHLAILRNGALQPVPAQIGIELTCITWLHTHDTSGLIHIEVPADKVGHAFVLDDFFQVWQQPLSATRAGPATGPNVTAWIQPANGGTAQKWGGKLGQVPLMACDAITLEVGAIGWSPPAYQFPTGFGCDGNASA